MHSQTQHSCDLQDNWLALEGTLKSVARRTLMNVHICIRILSVLGNNDALWPDKSDAFSSTDETIHGGEAKQPQVWVNAK